MGSRLRRAVLVLLLATSLAGCVSMPSGGPVLSYPVTQGPAGQGQRYVQIIAQPPGNGWNPQQIVAGFLTASASFGDGLRTAREYLTPAASAKWNPLWSATVYSKGPTPGQPKASLDGTQVVTVTGTVQANLSGYGSYAVPSASAPESSQVPFKLVKAGGQWRISDLPQELLLTSDSFQYDYQLRNLYFFDPRGHVLVPDPVYVPLQATAVDLMKGLVNDLITPPHDWLWGGATKTAFPRGTQLLTDVTLDGGTATVNLGGAITKASNTTLEQVSGQLLWTLTGSAQSGPAVQSVELSLDGKLWPPPGAQGNPVQRQSGYSPPDGASSVFYYLDRAGNVWKRTGIVGNSVSVKVAHIGTEYSQIAVSPSANHPYLAALRSDGTLFTGPLGGKLVKRGGTGYTTMSWDPHSDLWATTSDQIYMLPTDASPQGQPVPVTVEDYGGPYAGTFTALRVAPDGVRVAIIVNGSVLNFGAIVIQPGARPSQPNVKIELSPFSVAQADSAGTSTFEAVAWYGPDNVITLSEPDSVLTEYPVNGGSATSIPQQSQIQSITASSGYALIAGLDKGGLTADASLSGAWTDITGRGSSPAYPG